MAGPETFSHLALQEAYVLLASIRQQYERATQLLAQSAAMVNAVNAASAQLASRLATIGVDHRWNGDQLEIRNLDGDWVAGPHLSGPPQTGIDYRWTGTRLEIRDASGNWQLGPDLKGVPGAWNVDRAFKLPEVEFDASGDITLDLARYNTFRMRLTGNIDSVTLLHPPADGEGVRWAIYAEQDDQGERTIEGWPEEIRWTTLGPPLLSTSAGAVDLLVFDTSGNGQTRGSVAAQWQS